MPSAKLRLCDNQPRAATVSKFFVSFVFFVVNFTACR